MQENTHEIWLVDDNRAEHEMLRIAFAESDSTTSVRSFFSAEEAVDAVINGETPHLILLDINMPGLGGFYLLEQLVRHHVEYVPVIMLSTSANPDEVRAAYSRGANAYIEKPPDLESLENFVRAVAAFWFEVASLPPISMSKGATK